MFEFDTSALNHPDHEFQNPLPSSRTYSESWEMRRRRHGATSGVRLAKLNRRFQQGATRGRCLLAFVCSRPANPVESQCGVRITGNLLCFLAVRVMVSLKVLQLELSPPQTPHLSSCLEEPTTPSQPTFCSARKGREKSSAQVDVRALAAAH